MECLIYQALATQRQELEAKQPTVPADFMEAFAAVEHERWSDWMKYLFSKCLEVFDDGQGGMLIPNESVRRWQRQMNTPYSELSEREKESDRKQVRRYLPMLETKREEEEKLIDDRSAVAYGWLKLWAEKAGKTQVEFDRMWWRSVGGTSTVKRLKSEHEKRLDSAKKYIYDVWFDGEEEQEEWSKFEKVFDLAFDSKRKETKEIDEEALTCPFCGKPTIEEVSLDNFFGGCTCSPEASSRGEVDCCQCLAEEYVSNLLVSKLQDYGREVAERAEIIICAAVKFDSDYPHGRVIVGNFHGACFAVKGTYFKDAKEIEQGFVTSTGRFVGRKEALEIAAREGQIVKKHSPVDELTSEDLAPLCFVDASEAVREAMKGELNEKA